MDSIGDILTMLYDELEFMDALCRDIQDISGDSELDDIVSGILPALEACHTEEKTLINIILQLEKARSEVND